MSDDAAAWLEKVEATAKSARESGRLFYTAQVNLGGMERRPFGPYEATGGEDASGVLEVIERAGWHLEHAGYVYQPLKQKATAFTGQALMTGQILGVYTFRRVEQEP